ncbi:MAG: anaerobic ribonucleoside-triphosphate reductase activating protein [Eubacteriales bacterium]|nr:anaerobic ribonucleoside-triphosphate reductase activating protein [Eubacteriales bacterium]
MNYGEIKKYDIADGEGVRVALFVSGCTHHCKGCFNEETWDFHYGNPFTEDTAVMLLSALTPKYISGLTVLGGEPFEIMNQRSLLPFLRKVRETFPLKSIWCYTGYTLEKDLLDGGIVHCEVTDEILGLLDILVDGEFVESQKDISLVFRGSSNQRIIDLKATAAHGKTVLWNQNI